MAGSKYENRKIIPIDNLLIFLSPKSSSRAVNKICRQLENHISKNDIRSDEKKQTKIFIYRNPYKKLVSAFLNKYVEHDKYLKLARDQNADLSTFAPSLPMDKCGF